MNVSENKKGGSLRVKLLVIFSSVVTIGLGVLVALLSPASDGYITTSDGFSYAYSTHVQYFPDGLRINDYKYSKEDISIPRYLDGVPVKYLGNLFTDCTSVASVEIPDTVTWISSYAFRNCTSLTSVTIPDTVTGISDYAFWNCTSLTSVTIPDSVTFIYYDAFADCTSLSSVEISDSLTKIDDGTFAGCTSLRSVYIPDSVTEISYSAFTGCDSLELISVPRGAKINIGHSDTLPDWYHAVKYR